MWIEANTQNTKRHFNWRVMREAFDSPTDDELDDLGITAEEYNPFVHGDADPVEDLPGDGYGVNIDDGKVQVTKDIGEMLVENYTIYSRTNTDTGDDS